MGPAFGDVLPVAVGIAITPAAIIAAVMMLLSPKARTTSVAFLAGWLGGLAVAVTVFVLLAAVLPPPTDTGNAPIAGTVRIALGVGLLALVLRKRGRRAAGGDTEGTPAWMAAIDSITVGRAAGLGVLLSLVNPKNLLLAAGAGVTLGSAELSAGQTALAVAVYVLVAGSTVLVPVVAYLAAESAIAPHLLTLRTWLVSHNEAIMSVLLVVLGTVLIGKGIGSF